MENLSKEEMGEIALKYVAMKLYKDGFTISKSSLREINNHAKELGIPAEKLKEFLRVMVQETMDQVFK